MGFCDIEQFAIARIPTGGEKEGGNTFRTARKCQQQNAAHDLLLAHSVNATDTRPLAERMKQELKRLLQRKLPFCMRANCTF